MAYRKGTAVWVEDKQHAWVEADVINSDDKTALVLTSDGRKIKMTNEKILPRDADADHGGVDDMTKLSYLNEPGVLFNLAQRYSLNEIYTYTGSILIAVNPFTRLPHLYNMHMMEQYKGVRLGELSPHVFAVADSSYRAMMKNGRSQSVLVSGESGAGKTETTKLIMQYLTFVGGRVTGDFRTVEQQVLESNPLLEAFGNARTVRNDNSSRFGKFVEIQFDRTGRISGAAIRTYLLERSRVVQIMDPERNYHCFYQLCASGKDAEKYKLENSRKFHYLNQSKMYELEGINNAEAYLKTRRAMDIVGITFSDQEAIFRTLAAILHLGNIEFSPGEEHDSSVIKDEKSNFHLQMAADLLMCEGSLLFSTLSSRTIQTREGNIIKSLDTTAASTSRDTLAKTIYSQLFDWLVENINKSIGQDPDSKIQIGVLDIYGFECFKNNSFEQFCINFANEKLQQHFNEHVFKLEQEEYRKEDISWSYIDFVDNQDVLELIEKKPIGIISLLDEACMLPKSTHGTFATKLFQNLQSHQRLQKPKFSQTDFTLSHYAGKVTYKTDLFLDKNKDYVVSEHQALLSSSKCPFISELFNSLKEENSRSSYKFSSVTSRFKQQLQALMETLNSTEPHYIRCIKPSSLNCPQKFENQSVLHQLRCGGVLEAIKISLAGYPTRKTYSEFVDRYGILAQELLYGRLDEKSLTDRIIKKLKLENFQLGKTMVFLRAGQIAILDSKRADVLDRAAKIVQGHVKTFIAHKHFLFIKNASTILQAFCRGCLAREEYKTRRKTKAAMLIQKYARMNICRKKYLILYSATLIMQSIIRGHSVSTRLMHMKQHKAAIVIQAQWRMLLIYRFYHKYCLALISIQCCWRKKLAKREFIRLKQAANEAGSLREAKSKLENSLEDIQLRLTLEKKLRVAAEESKALEVSKLLEDLETLKMELETSKQECIREKNKNLSLETQLETLHEEQFQKNHHDLEEMKEENLSLKSEVKSLLKKNEEMEEEFVKATKSNHENIDKFRDLEGKYMHLCQTVENLEMKLSNLEEENQILRQRALSSPRGNLPGHGIHNIFLCSTWEYQELLKRCIKEELGFKEGKPIASCIIYKCLVHWGLFEAEKTAIFDCIISNINSVLKLESEKDILPYWLANASALLCLLQRNLRSGNSAPPMLKSVTSSPCIDKYPAMLFKQQLTACLEKIFGLIRDNVKKEISPLLSLCIQAPKATRASGNREGNEKQSLSSHWDCIIDFLDLLMHRLRNNFALSVRQIYRICTMYWDDKYGAQSISSEVVATMRDLVNKEAQNLLSNSFLLDDDLSIPFSPEEISKAIPVLDPTDINPPPSLCQIQAAQFLIPHLDPSTL